MESGDPSRLLRSSLRNTDVVVAAAGVRGGRLLQREKGGGGRGLLRPSLLQMRRTAADVVAMLLLFTSLVCIQSSTVGPWLNRRMDCLLFVVAMGHAFYYFLLIVSSLSTMTK